MTGDEDFKRDGDGGHRGLEQAREARGHARDKQNAGGVLDVDFRTDVVPERAADLHRDTLAPRAPAEQVGDPGGRHDEWDQAQGNFAFLAVRGIEHESHAAFRALADLLVREYYHDTRQRQCRNPVHRMHVADVVHALEHLPEEGSKRTDDCTEEQGRNGEYWLRKPAGEFLLDLRLRHAHGLFFHLRTHVPVHFLPVVEIHCGTFFFAAKFSKKNAT